MFSKDPLINILDSLVSYATVDGEQSAIENCFEYVATFLKDRGMHVKAHRIQGHPSIVATSQYTKSPKILLQAHLDVVPGHDDQFSLKLEGDRLIGRGVIDMKFAAACFMLLADELMGSLKNYDFGIMFTSDEETGGEHGVKALLQRGYRGQICILPDGGDNWQLMSSAKGAWFVRLFASGEMAHGSRPWEGISATDKLIQTIIDIQKYFKSQNKEEDTLNVSTMLGGSAMNQVADSAEATLDIRYVDQQNFDIIQKVVTKATQKHGTELETLYIAPDYKADLDHPLVQTFTNILKHELKQSLKTTVDYGSSDARYFAPYDIPCILIRPTGGGAHTDHEWVSLKELHKFYSIIVSYVKQKATMNTVDKKTPKQYINSVAQDSDVRV